MKVKVIMALAISSLTIWSCSNDANPIPSVSHPAEWNKPGSEVFHGNKVLAVGSESCMACHGTDYSGGNSGVSCLKCHATFPHPPTWATPGNDSSHAAFLKAQSWNTEPCENCHGEDYSGGSSGVSCYSCHTNYPHPPGWTTPESENSHAAYLEAQDWDMEACKNCHGVDFSGGSSGVSCYTCHANFPHPPDWTTPGSDNSHAVYLKSDYWDMEPCKDCHGDDYAGGSTGVSCLTCHTNTGGPEACNTCHGTIAKPVTDISGWAPPEDLDDNLSTEEVGVGAHQVHLTGSTWSTAYSKDCSLCHPSLTGFDDPMHINGTVDIAFNSAATDAGRVNPVWSAGSTSCSDVYCHGNFVFREDESDYAQYGYIDTVIVGNNALVNWTNVGSGEAACGTCHGLPPTGHSDSPNCAYCHTTVVEVVNGQQSILDKNLHMNGKIDVFDASYRP